MGPALPKSHACARPGGLDAAAVSRDSSRLRNGRMGRDSGRGGWSARGAQRGPARRQPSGNNPTESRLLQGRDAQSRERTSKDGKGRAKTGKDAQRREQRSSRRLSCAQPGKPRRAAAVGPAAGAGPGRRRVPGTVRVVTVVAKWSKVRTEGRKSRQNKWSQRASGQKSEPNVESPKHTQAVKGQRSAPVKKADAHN